MLPPDAVPINQPKSKLPPDAVPIQQPEAPDQNQIAQDSAKYGSITKTPTTFERMGKNLTSPKTKPFGLFGPAGVAMSMAGIPEENALPMAGQAIGGLASGFTGSGFLGATGGATLGQGAKQLVGMARGNKPDLGQVGKEALTTGAIEGATRGVGGLVFRRQVANELLGTLGKKLGQMKQAISTNPNLSIPSEKIYIPLKQAVEGVAVPHGPQSTIINKWLKFMENNPTLSGKHLIELETDLGEAAKYGQMEKGAFVQPSGIKKPALNTIAKNSRTQVSNEVDRLAEEGGQKGFGETSKKISKLLENPDKTDVTRTHGGFGSRLVAAGAVGGVTQNPFAGAGTYLAMQALQSPELRNLAFKIMRSPAGVAVNTGTKLSLSELARRMSQ